MGDFNMKSVVHDECYNAKLEHFMLHVYNFKQFISQETTDYHTTLDLIFTNEILDTVDVIDNYWSDHKMIYATVPLSNFVHL